ncbi:MAG: porin family protein [Sulfurospirillum sp.]|nr:porin family protein [Sulfurospirillum sp.]
MKKSIVAASLLMMGSALMAADMGNGWFMGTEFGGMDIKMKATASSGGTTASITDTMNTTYESIKIGKYFDNSRIYTALNYQNKKDDFSSWSWGLGYDYLIKNSSSITPFIGANVSYIKGKVDDMPVLDKPAGFAAGVEAGLIYALSPKAELEAGIRYMNISNVEDSGSISGVSVKLEGKTATQYYLGINYKF